MNAEKSSVSHNVDREEIAKFEAVASRWRDLEGEFKPLRRISPLRLGYIVERANGLFGKEMLNVGCDGDILAESMARGSATVTGLDMDFEPLQVTGLYTLENGIQVDYMQETVEEYVAKHAEQYDAVTCMKMLEHAPGPQSVVRTCARLVKPGGDVFFSTFSRNGKSWPMAVVDVKYIPCMMPKGTHDVKKFIKPAELLSRVDQTSLKERHMTGPHYNPTTNSFKLGPGVGVNYMLYTQNKWGCCLDLPGNRAKLDVTLATPCQAYGCSPWT